MKLFNTLISYLKIPLMGCYVDIGINLHIIGIKISHLWGQLMEGIILMLCIFILIQSPEK
jgi:hypothetical protein